MPAETRPWSVAPPTGKVTLVVPASGSPNQPRVDVSDGFSPSELPRPGTRCPKFVCGDEPASASGGDGPLSNPDLLLGLLMVALGATVQATIGFGAALVAVPLLLLVDPRFVPGPVVIAGLAVNLVMIIVNWGHADWRGVRLALVGLVPGTVLAGVALALVSGTSLSLLSAGAILAAVGISAAGHVPRRGRRTMIGAGFFSGYLGTTAGVGGPPLALAYQDAEGRTIRATLPLVFLVGAGLTLATLVTAGRFAAADLRTGLLLAPGGFVGFATSRALTGRIDDARLRRLVLALSALSASAVIIRIAL